MQLPAAAPHVIVSRSNAEVTEKTDPKALDVPRADSPGKSEIPIGTARAIIAALGGALVIAVVVLASQIDSSPSVSIPEEKLQEFAEKRAAMAAAETLCNEGKLHDCVAAYDAYLASYPWASAAREARAEAARLEQMERRGGTKESTRNAWQRFKGRVKSVFGND